jgi:hypothetical protein
MTSTNLPLYRLLVKFGASEADADSAASLDDARLATKADLQLVEARLEGKLEAMQATIIKWNIATIGVVAGLFAAISAALRFVK